MKLLWGKIPNYKLIRFPAREGVAKVYCYSKGTINVQDLHRSKVMRWGFKSFPYINYLVKNSFRL